MPLQSINIALGNGWKGATLSNSSPVFLKRMMKVSYQKNPELLFFVQADKSNQLTYDDLKEIKKDLTFNELKTAIKNALIVESEYSIVVDAMHRQAISAEDITFSEALKYGYTITDLDKRTAQELRNFHKNNSFKPIKNTIKPNTASPAGVHNEEYQSVFEEITNEVNRMKPINNKNISKASRNIDAP